MHMGVDHETNLGVGDTSDGLQEAWGPTVELVVDEKNAIGTGEDADVAACRGRLEHVYTARHMDRLKLRLALGLSSSGSRTGEHQ